MMTAILTIGGIIIGAIATYIVSSYFFKKSIKEKALVPYVQFSTKIFSSIDPDLQRDLDISYKEVKVDNLHQMQFVIANTGDKSIRDCIRPLELILPENFEILDVKIIYIDPEEREIIYSIDNTNNEAKVAYNFPLLNKNEYFVTKILLKSNEIESQKSDIDKEKSLLDKLKFKITVDELPPVLKIEELPFSHFSKSKKVIDYTGVWIISILLLVTIALTGTLYVFNDVETTMFLFNFKQFFNNFSLFSLCILVSWLAVILFIVVIVVGSIETIKELKPENKPKFKLPSKLSKEFHGFWE
jgi:hypothetical protein